MKGTSRADLSWKGFMANASLTSRGRTTIPRSIRDSLGLQPRDQLNFTLMPDSTVTLRAKTRKPMGLAGADTYSGPVIPVVAMRMDAGTDRFR